MESISGLPAHVLFVHAPVVLTPLVCAAAVALALVPRWRAKLRWWLLGASVVVVVAMLLAISSGEAFEDVLDGAAPTEKHRDLAEATRLIMFGWFASVLALVGLDRWAGHRSDGGTHAARLAVSALTVVTAVLLTVWVYRTGHEGARITWDGVIPE